jgi:hypothetical protein
MQGKRVLMLQRKILEKEYFECALWAPVMLGLFIFFAFSCICAYLIEDVICSTKKAE